MIPEHIHKALREKYNPEGSLLRRQQMRMLDILHEIDRICKKHGLNYWLSSGTLLGAVRHGGFIPWDDDLDIEMMREDYELLMKVLPHELPDTMALQTHETDPAYFFFYAKVRDRRSVMSEGNGYDRLWKEKGIYIDIFPIEKQTIPLHVLTEKTVGHVYKIWRTCTDDAKGIKSVMRLFHFNRLYVFPVVRLLCSLFPTRTYTYGMGIPYHTPRYKDDIFPLKTMLFEGEEFPVPCRAENVMRIMYGDYMKLPPEDSIATHCERLSFID